jgi:serpin B
MDSRFFKLLSVLVLLSLVFSACTPGTAPDSARSERKRDLNPAPSPDEVNRLVDGNNSFAWDLYHSLQDGQGNLVFSPFSISLALAMTYAGARGGTESQMQRALHFDAGQSVHAAYNSLDLVLENVPEPADSEQKRLQLRIANAVWAEKSFTFLPGFLDTLAVNYGAGLQLADFVHQPEAVRKDVNQWVEEKTEKRIKDVVPPGAFDTDTRMALVNAIYFNGDWADQFDANHTHDGDFHVLDGSLVTAPIMNQTMFVPYAAGDGWQMVELPYAGGTASMVILVPDPERFQEVEKMLDNQEMQDMMDSLQPVELALSLPKFRFESSFGLADQLSALGMPDAFDRLHADFSGMTGQPDLYISSVVHKAFVSVDEEGTEAAAATVVIMGVTGAMMPPQSLTIDRPFIFAIRHKSTGQILFLGRLLDPS